MQYRNYEIQCTDYCYIVRDSVGNYLTSVENDDEAKDYIDELLDKEESNATIQFHHDLYDIFCKYCNKLSYKFYIQDKLATTNIVALNNIIRSFEKETNARVHYHVDLVDGERVAIVDIVTY